MKDARTTFLLGAGKGGSGSLGEAEGRGLAKRLWWRLLQAALVPAQTEMAISLEISKDLHAGEQTVPAWASRLPAPRSSS